MDIAFEVDGKEYHAHLNRGYISFNGRDRRYTECILTTNNPIEIYSGITYKNPNDGMEYDENYGYRLAFKRALFQMFSIRQLKKGGRCIYIYGWETFMHKFRVPFGKALHNWIAEIPY